MEENQIQTEKLLKCLW